MHTKQDLGTSSGFFSICPTSTLVLLMWDPPPGFSPRITYLTLNSLYISNVLFLGSPARCSREDEAIFRNDGAEIKRQFCQGDSFVISITCLLKREA